MYKVIRLPHAIMRYYLPGFQVTENYAKGMSAIGEDRLEDSVKILESEHGDSPCRGLAIGNAGMSLLVLGRFESAEAYLIEANEEFKKNGCPHPASWVQFARNRAEAIRQIRPQESLLRFEQAIQLLEHLAIQYPDFQRDITFEAAHALNSWGGSLLENGNPSKAIDCFQRARDIYREQSDPERIGEAEVLTNLALAFKKNGEATKASLALSEALDIAKSQSNADQLWRVKIAIIQLDPILLGDESYSILQDAARDAIENGRYSSAYLKHCIRATVAEKMGDLGHAIEACNDARAIEGNLDRGDVSPVKMRLTLAGLLEANGNSSEELLNALLEGARMWWDLLSVDQIFNDVLAKSQDMHDHFRELARKLLEAGRVAESCMAFESGRALGFALEVNRAFLSDFLGMTPFKSEDNIVDCSPLLAVQESLELGEVCVSFAILPPHTVVYVIRQNRVDSLIFSNPDESSIRGFVDDVCLVSSRLGQGVGLRAIPQLILEWVDQIKALVGTGNLVAIVPNSFLHGLPWRALLKARGMRWDQLSCITRFGLLIKSPKLTTDSSDCVALGCGIAGSIDLNDEARDFAHFFGARGSFVKNASSAEVKIALMRNGIVIVSCHGDLKASFDTQTKQLYLSLNGGDVAAKETWPDRVSAGLVVLSACDSGVYNLAHSDYPVGAAPDLLRRGAQLCLGTRFPVNARFAADLMREFGMRLASGDPVPDALSGSLDSLEMTGVDFWRDLTCFELIG